MLEVLSQRRRQLAAQVAAAHCEVAAAGRPSYSVSGGRPEQLLELAEAQADAIMIGATAQAAAAVVEAIDQARVVREVARVDAAQAVATAHVDAYELREAAAAQVVGFVASARRRAKAMIAGAELDAALVTNAAEHESRNCPSPAP